MFYLRAARESIDRSFLVEQTFDDGYIYVRERARSYFVLAKILCIHICTMFT